MKLPDFTPIAVGELDWRAFDYTKDLDGETLSNLRVTCTFIGPTGSDPSPQAMVNTVQLQTSITELVGPQNTPVTKTGQFLAVYLGEAPSSAAGGYYLLQGLVDTATRRNLSLSARMLCGAT